MRTFSRAALRVALVALVLVLAVGCKASRKRPPEALAEAEPAPARAAQQTPSQAEAEPRVPAPRLVIKEAKLALRSPKPEALIGRSGELAQRFDGFVVKSETSHVEARVVKAEVSLRVRAEKLDAALAELRKLGEVLSESVTGQDVSAEFVDVQARLKAKRVLEERLLAIAAEAKAVEDMLKVETELSRVRSDIEQLEGRSRLLQDRARLSLIEVTAESPHQPTEPEAQSLGSKLSSGFERAWRLAGDVVVGLIVVAGVLSPLVVVVALLAAPLIWWWMRRRRRRHDRAAVS